MREIKFRVWLPSIKKLTYALTITDWANGYEQITIGQDCVWQQYTGLKDKNGKEIYEGDRLGFTINFSDESARAYWSESGFTGLVYWDKSGWAINEIVFQKMFNVAYVFSMQGREFDQRLLERYSKIKSKSFNNITDIEVIGNIYEHGNNL